jgi:hypothetical protein
MKKFLGWGMPGQAFVTETVSVIVSLGRVAFSLSEIKLAPPI